MEKKIKKFKSLQLSRETLRDLNSSEAQKVLGGNGGPACQSQAPGTCCAASVDVC